MCVLLFTFPGSPLPDKRENFGRGDVRVGLPLVGAQGREAADPWIGPGGLHATKRTPIDPSTP